MAGTVSSCVVQGLAQWVLGWSLGTVRVNVIINDEVHAMDRFENPCFRRQCLEAFLFCKDWVSH